MHGIPEALIHERTHFGQLGKYTCAEKDGGLATKRWSDFLRHATTRHCANAEEKKFPCTVVGCKYGGGNGFRRKDKLKNERSSQGSQSVSRTWAGITIDQTISALGYLTGGLSGCEGFLGDQNAKLKRRAVWNRDS